MTGEASTAGSDRVVERRRAVALARHYRESEGLSIREIADRLGRTPATVKAYFYDPTGEKARAVKARGWSSPSLGEVAGVWNEVPESTCVIVRPGGAELRPFRPAPPSTTMTGVA